MCQPPSSAAGAAGTDGDLSALVARLAARVAALEAALAAGSGQRGPPAPDAVPEEILPVLIAAAAAYLGVRPVLRQVRLAESAAWAQAGRAGLQASHALPLHPRTGA
jgi:hypothetical protein